jgi:hypothetical protein
MHEIPTIADESQSSTARMPPRAGTLPAALEVTPFEQYMLADDRREFPMTFTLQMHLSGEIDRALFEAALPLALARHPLFAAKIEERRPRKVWVAAERQVPAPTWLAHDQPLTFPGRTEHIDLAREPGIRNWIQTGDGRVVLSTQFHHAICDGIGGLQFWGDWLAAYESLVTGEAPRWQPLDAETLRTRGSPRWKANAAKVSIWKAWSARIRETVQWLTRTSASICAPRRDPAPPLPFPATHSFTFNAAETAALRDAARSKNATLNDLMLHDLLSVMKQFDRRPGVPLRNKDWLQINIPTSLRDARDQSMPAANVLGYAFLTRRVSDCRTGDALLRGIAEETAAIRKWNLGMFFIDGLATAQRYPLLLRFFTGSQRCFATTVFSNLGDVTRRFHARLPRVAGRIVAGKLTLERITGVPPLRPRTHLTMTAMFCSGEMTLTVRSNPEAFDAPATAEFLDRLIETLRARIPA